MQRKRHAFNLCKRKRIGKGKDMRKLFLILCLSLTAMMGMAQTTIKVQAPNIVTLNEQFNVTFIIEGDRPSSFEWNEGDDWKNIWGPTQGRSSSVQIINGKRTESSKTTYSYVISPVTVGTFAIPKAKAVVEGKEIFSTDVKIEVLPGASSQSQKTTQANQQAQSNDSDNVSSPATLLVTEVSQTDVVVGQPVTAAIKLYTNENVNDLGDYWHPEFSGFKIQSVDAPNMYSFQREVYDGTVYNTTVLCEYELIPQTAGTMEIEPAELVYFVAVPVHGSLFGQMRHARYTVASNPVKVNVQSLPSPRPDSFAGGIGTFSVSAYVNNDNLKTHDYASLTVKVSGTGNLMMLEIPKVDFPAEMEVYDPTSSSSMAADGVSGTYMYEFPFIPRSVGEYEIGPFDYTYYDVNRRDYVTVTVPAIPISVAQGEESASVATTWYGSQNKVSTRDKDIRYIDTKSSGFNRKGDFFLGSSLFWIIVLSLCVAAITAWLFFRRYAARNDDVAAMKRRKATKMALKRLRKAGDLLKMNDSSAFYEELHNALLGYVSDKLNMPVAELSKEKISERLSAAGVSESVISELVGILDTCEFARYAPSAAGQAMTTDYEKAIEVISSIDSSMKSIRRISGKYTAVMILMCCFTSASATTESDPDYLWNAACESYEQGNYAEAASYYEAVSDMGLESPALYYNTANAYFQQGKLAKAILYYERALKLDPSYDDAKYNLDHANTLIQDKIDSVPEFFLKEWLRSISYMMDSDSWAVTFLVLLGITLVLVLTYLTAHSVAWRRTGFYVGILTLLLMFCALSFSLWQKSDYEDSDKAIVMRDLKVRSTPSEDASMKVLFELHPGTKVNVLEIKGSSMKISIADGRQGWVNTYDMDVI